MWCGVCGEVKEQLLETGSLSTLSVVLAVAFSRLAGS